jgi:hypothetical protein
MSFTQSLRGPQAAAWLFAIAISASACGKHAAVITQGKVPTTGVARYDDFFGAVHQLQEEAGKGDQDEKDARGSLVRAMGLEDPDVPTSVSEAQTRAKKMKEVGVLLHLDLVPEPKLVIVRGSASLDASQEATLKAVETSVKAELALETKLSELARRAADLDKQRTELRAQAPDAFRTEPQAKRDDVINELEASTSVIATAGDLAAKHAGRASKFVLELAHAVETGAGTEAPPAPPPTAVAKGGRPPGGKRPPAVAQAGSKPPPPPATKPASAPATKPAAKPAGKKGKGGDDFEP